VCAARDYVPRPRMFRSVRVAVTYYIPAFVVLMCVFRGLWGLPLPWECLCSCERGVVYSGQTVRDKRFGEDLYVFTKTE